MVWEQVHIWRRWQKDGIESRFERFILFTCSSSSSFPSPTFLSPSVLAFPRSYSSHFVIIVCTSCSFSSPLSFFLFFVYFVTCFRLLLLLIFILRTEPGMKCFLFDLH